MSLRTVSKILKPRKQIVFCQRKMPPDYLLFKPHNLLNQPRILYDSLCTTEWCRATEPDSSTGYLHLTFRKIISFILYYGNKFFYLWPYNKHFRKRRYTFAWNGNFVEISDSQVLQVLIYHLSHSLLFKVDWAPPRLRMIHGSL